MLRQTAILAAVTALLKSKYGSYPVYTNEIIEGFKQPCFFVKLIRRTDTETVNINGNSLSIIITYFADPAANKEIAYLNMTDDLSQLFNVGFKAGDRYLHTKAFTADRIGEKQDILQITIQIDYLDDTGRGDSNAGYDIMKNLNEKLIVTI